MSGVEFKNFRFDPNTSLMSDADEETNDSPSMLTNGSLKNDSSELNVTKDVSEIDKSDDDDEEELIGRTARKARVRARYVMSDSDASDYENGADDSIEDNPEDPSFGATRKQHRMNRLPAAIRRAINKPANKAQVVTIPALRKESDDYRPLKVIDKGIGKESSNDAISKRNVIMLNDSSNESSSLPTSQIDDLQSMLNDDTSSTSRSNDRWLANPSNKVNGIETPKRKKANLSDDDDITLLESKKKKQRRRVRAFDDDSSNEAPPRLSNESSKENSGPKVDDPEAVDDLQVMLEEDQSDLSQDSDYSEDEIVFDSEGDDDNEPDDRKVKPKIEKADTSVINLKAMILEMLNNGSEADLLNVVTMTRKKLDAVLSMRPFENWYDIMAKFENSPVLPIDLLENLKNNVKCRYIITQLLTNCQRISDQIKNTVKNLEELAQPRIMSPKLKLKPYQLIGLNWMAMMHEKGINGILADEMGLGKTVQVISLLAHLRMNKGIRGPHMVIVPSSILTNWSREFSTWCPSIKVLEYHGSQAYRAELRQQIYSRSLKYDVLLTTYNMCYSNDDRKLFLRTKFNYIVFDEAHMLKNMKSARFSNLHSLKSRNRLMLTGTPIQNNLLELMTLLLFTMPNMFGSKRSHIESFFRDKKIETDNQGFVKNRIDQAKEILKPFILRRLKENVLTDLPSKIEKYEQIPMSENQKKIYDQNIEAYKKQFAEMRQERLEAKKSRKKVPEVEILDTKRRRNMRTYDEDKLFDAAEAETETAITEVYVSESSNDSVMSIDSGENIELAKSNLKKSSAMLMELRKAANHPLLMRTNYTDDILIEMARTLKQKEDYYRTDGNVQFIFEDMQIFNDFDLHSLCKKFPSIRKYQLSEDKILDSGKFQYLDVFLPKLIAQGQRVLIFSQFQMMLDILEEYLRIRKHRFVRLDGATKVTERMGIIDNFYEDKDIRVFLITTKAGGLGINLVEANHVVIHDIDFNPYNDKQAEDRAHRMGQTQEVHVFKLVSSDSIEVHMMNTCIRKLEVGRTITSDQIENENGKAAEARDIKAMLKNALKM